MNFSIIQLRTLTAGLAAAALALPAAVSANFSLGGPLSMLPADTEMAIAFKLDPGDNAESFLHYLPRKELSEYLKEKWEADNNAKPEMGELSEVALALTFHPDMLPVVRMVAMGGKEMSGTPGAGHYVLGGTFTKTHVNTVLESIGAPALGDDSPSTITGATGEAVAHYFMPRDGILLVSLDQAWLGAADGHLRNRTGLASEASTFRSLGPLIGGRDADAFVYISAPPVVASIAPMIQDPNMAQMVGMLRQARALGVGIYPGADASNAEVSITFPDTSNAQIASLLLNGLLEMGKGMAAMQIMGMANDPAIQSDPEAQKNMQNSLQLLQSLAVKQEGNASVLRIPIDRTNLGEPAEARAWIMDMVRQQDQAGGMDFNMPQGGLFPPPGSGAPAW